MNNNDIPVWEKYTLTIEEASKYFRIGENKLRRLAEENKDAGWLITALLLHLHPLLTFHAVSDLLQRYP